MPTLIANIPMTVDACGWTVAIDPRVTVRPNSDEALVQLATVNARRAADSRSPRRSPSSHPSSHRSGALLIRNVPIGALPDTPATPSTPVDKDLATELTVLTVARLLGQPVGYLPEHGGRIVQNIVPTRTDADRQTSTSSRSNLMFHTETAFHPHRPRYLLLLCLRGDPAAHTTMASVHDIVDVAR